MSVFRCKMCGGTIEFEEGATVGVCDSCGTKQTLPRLDSDRKANLYDRANHFRRSNDFDKAMSIYEQILNEDNTDSEAYWSLVLCRYGIEYVEDPSSHKRIPTVNRAQYTSILADEDYKAALRYADGYQRSIYEEEARAIDDIQKGILEISTKEEPFDVFISFKETDANGRRTPDAVLANDLYHQLTQEGFKVFYAPITLEDKLGTAYEPYIFAALNSAKVMVVLGTKPENFNAVWVKNEWSRYLALIKNGAKKTLIPAYKDMDPYDLPEEFSHLMAQDMSKLGFMQDLIRGIRKIVNADAPKTTVKETVVVNAGNANTAPLLKRAFMFLEDGNWSEADGYCERVLDQDPENAKAYLGKLMAEKKARRQEDLKDSAEPFDTSSIYQKVIRFADPALADTLRGYIKHINERNENDRLEGIYGNALRAMSSASSESAYKSASGIFKSIPGYKDSDTLSEECLEKAEECRKNDVYDSARALMAGEKTEDYESAIKVFRTISGWKDSERQLYDCQKKIEEIRQNEEKARIEAERKAEERRIAAEKAKQKTKKVLSVVIPAAILALIAIIVVTKVVIPKQKLNKAMGMLDSGDYEAAYALLEEIGNSDAIASSKYNRAIALIDSGDYEAAYALLEEIGNSDAIASSKYNRAIALIDSGDYEGAYILLDGLNYKDSSDRLDSIKPEYQTILFARAEIGSYVSFGAYEQDNDTSDGKENIEWLVLDKQGDKVLVISKYALDCQQYNTSYSNVTWETCTLRAWLNGTFLNNAFTSGEQAMIASTTVAADNNPNYSTDPGNATNDKVFLLSITEAEKYFSSDSTRQCAPTAYAVAQGAYADSDYKTAEDKAACWWWLRSPGNYQCFASFVLGDGSIYYLGDLVLTYTFAIRPALWVDLSKTD